MSVRRPAGRDGNVRRREEEWQPRPGRLRVLSPHDARRDAVVVMPSA
ncbi:hypothetical protein ACFWCA_14895 [Streptomyces phaeochromogenes]